MPMYVSRCDRCSALIRLANDAGASSSACSGQTIGEGTNDEHTLWFWHNLERAL